jgi:hypothetical protein
MRKGMFVLAAASLLAVGPVAFAEQHDKEKSAGTTGAQVSCDQIEAAWDEGGGGVSEDMLAKKLNVPIERIRSCLKKESMDLKKSETPPSTK